MSSSSTSSEQGQFLPGQIAQRPIQPDLEHFQAGAVARTRGQGITQVLLG